jgi:hypothetical protein
MKSPDNKALTHPVSNTLPQLEDPKHPGMFFINRIVLTSVALFLTLFALATIAAFTVELNFELTLQGIGQDDYVVVYADEAQANLLMVGNRATLESGDGQRLDARVFAIEKGPESVEILLKPSVESADDNSLTDSVITYQATIFTTYSLWSYFQDRIAY